MLPHDLLLMLLIRQVNYTILIAPLFLFGLLFGISTYAADNIDSATVIDCWDGPSSIGNIVEPLNDNTRTYGNGNIRIVHLDNGGEPACCSSYVAILAPDPSNNFDGRQCKMLVSDHSGLGFSGLTIKDVKSSYDSKAGLLLNIPVTLLVEGGSFTEHRIHLRINLLSGKIAIEHQ